MGECPDHRKWMYNRFLDDGGGYSDEFLIGVESFVSHAMQQSSYQRDGVIRCPCRKHKNRRFYTVDEVKVCLYKRGFMDNYWYWTDHGEVYPDTIECERDHSNVGGMSDIGPSNRFEHMIFDAGPSYVRENLQANYGESPNSQCQRFYDMLDAARQQLWPGCNTHTELSWAMRMLSIKSDFNQPQRCFDQIMQLCAESHPPNNLVPPNLYEAKKLVQKLGLGHKKIDCCMNDCMIYYKDDINERQCKICGTPRYKQRMPGRSRGKEVAFKRLYYMPLIPRLQRLYASMKSAPHMKWHHEHHTTHGVMCHPSDGEAWMYFDRTYPHYSSEPRNVRLGLCSDGFTPYNQSAAPYSCWPVIVTPYNLPPEMCNTPPYMFLTLIIPGPNNPKSRIDVFLQPLIDELLLLWNEGVLTYDVSTKQNFVMRANLMWTINDFPAYGMLSGWMTAGRLACPICMEHTNAFTLKNGKKQSWFDCHRMSLDLDHPFRRNKGAFKKNKIEQSGPPVMLNGDQLWERVCNFPQVTEMWPIRLPGYGITHNWTKRSIFWDLPYWRSNLIRHNLDVMHVEKNVFDNIFNTVMDIKGKTKDNVKARMDLKEYCRRRELELQEQPNGKVYKPKAKFALNIDKKRAICEWVKELRMPDDYASKLDRSVDVREGRIFGMKSHDCHVFMERLLPLAFRALPDCIWKPLTELSQFFRDICSTVLQKEGLQHMHKNIPIIICKLERIFPPGFFNVMEHLPIHLPYEALVGGPVQYRWMYPYERFLNKLKQKVKNKARPEGSICEAYLIEEIAHFCQYYFEPHVQSYTTRVRRNDDGCEDETSTSTLSIFKLPGRPSGACSSRFLEANELDAAHLYVLLNCDEVEPYKNIFIQWLRMMHQNITDQDIEEMLAQHFRKWFQDFVLNPENGVHNQCLHDLAYGPSRKVKTWPIYFVNGYKFHTSSCAEGKKTNNSGVCVKGTGNVYNGEDDFYGILKEVLQIEYPGLPIKRLVLFACEWFDPVIDRGMKIYKEYGIVEVNHTRKYSKYDPFIYAHQATQVYYAPYPRSVREKYNWWVVIKTKPRGMIENNTILEGAYQSEEVSTSHPILELEPIDSLVDIDAGLEEVEASTVVGDDIVEDGTSENEDEEPDLTDSNDSVENSTDDQLYYSDSE